MFSDNGLPKTVGAGPYAAPALDIIVLRISQRSLPVDKRPLSAESTKKGGMGSQPPETDINRLRTDERPLEGYLKVRSPQQPQL